MIRNKIVFFVVIQPELFAKKSTIFEEDLRKKINSLNSDVNVWKIAHYKNDPSILTIFLVHKDE